jgi:hypothetical protein
MVDITVNSAELKDGVLTVTGSGFTKTTTSVFLDDSEYSSPFEVWSDGEIRLNVDSVTEITVQKGDITRTITVVRGGAPAAGGGGQTAAPVDSGASTSDSASTGPYDPSGDAHQEGYKTATPNTTPGDLTEDDLKTTGDASQADLAQGASTGAAPPPEPNREPYAEGEHLDHDFRTRVEGTAVVPVEQLGIGPRDPYPEGHPPDPEEVFKELHGYPRPQPTDKQTPQTSQAAAAAQAQEA